MSPSSRVVPLLPLRSGVLFPGVAMPFAVGRDISLGGVEAAIAREDKDVVVVSQRTPEGDPKQLADLHRIGVRGQVRTLQRSPHATTVVVQGLERVFIEDVIPAAGHMLVRVRSMPILVDEGPETEALCREVQDAVQRLVHLARGEDVPALDTLLRGEEDRVRFVFTVASLIGIDAPKGQELLEQTRVSEALRTLLRQVTLELQVLEVRHHIAHEVAGQLDKEQRDYVLRKQLRTIQSELGDVEAEQAELNELKARLANATLPEHARREAERELKRLERLPTAAHEYHLIRGYIEFILELPWQTATEARVDIKEARTVLEQDHHGLADVKERILEHLAILRLNPLAKAPILNFVGPPGVGKTSLGQSVARALGRKFERMSLGGLHDEAELRGHRRTYVGAMPGRILQAIRRTGVNNPLIMLDEVDKVGADFRGDPAAALLEILDPEQNSQFRDNYLDLPFDLSHVMFITTCNALDTIARPLLDRMEVIRLDGYSDEEKRVIAERYLLPRQLERAGVAGERLAFNPDVVPYLIRHHTREAGVRQLERVIARVIRKVALRFAEGKDESVALEIPQLGALLGPEPFFGDALRVESVPGVAAGLAWTEVGGTLLYVETAALPGSRELLLTGHLGDVMQESAKAALTCVWSRADRLGIAPVRMRESSAHVHVPSGAVPKDGPSAGVTIATALASLYTGLAVRTDTAMTGEITITGMVLPVGGLKDKLLAARRAGVKTVILPRANEQEVRQVAADVTAGLRLVYAERIEDVWFEAIPELTARAPTFYLVGDGRRPVPPPSPTMPVAH